MVAILREVFDFSPNFTGNIVQQGKFLLIFKRRVGTAFGILKKAKPENEILVAKKLIQKIALKKKQTAFFKNSFVHLVDLAGLDEKHRLVPEGDFCCVQVIGAAAFFQKNQRIEIKHHDVRHEIQFGFVAGIHKELLAVLVALKMEFFHPVAAHAGVCAPAHIVRCPLLT
ncbi:MAG: hypothetical protein NW241_12230 [Bacteroidia bacterium]|nr:hypothetical protein [Bacteroidia bacterium]